MNNVVVMPEERNFSKQITENGQKSIGIGITLIFLSRAEQILAVHEEFC